MTDIWKTVETYDIVCAAIALILIIFTLFILVYYVIISIKEKKKVKEYIQKQEEKIELIKSKIQMTQDLDTLGLVKTWVSQSQRISRQNWLKSLLIMDLNVEIKL